MDSRHLTIILVFIGIMFLKTLFNYRAKQKVKIWVSEGAKIIDVRTSAEYMAGHNPNSINIPTHQISNKIQELDPKVSYILCCASGTRSAMVLSQFKMKGLKVLNAGSWKNTLI